MNYGYDYAGLIKRRLSARFSGAENMTNYLSVFLDEAVELEAVFKALSDSRNINNASGNALDKIGYIVDAERDELSGILGYQVTDEEYRLYIKAKITKNWSAHTVDDVISAITYILDVSTVRITQQGGAVVLIEFNRPLDPAEKTILLDLGMIPKPAGVRYTYIVPTQDVPFGFLGTSNTLGFGDENIPGSGGTFLSEL